MKDPKADVIYEEMLHQLESSNSTQILSTTLDYRHGSNYTGCAEQSQQKINIKHKREWDNSCSNWLYTLNIFSTVAKFTYLCLQTKNQITKTTQQSQP